MPLDDYKKLIAKLKEAERLVFFTGAGVSAESGIPTFRGKEGLWNKFKPEELANFDAFIGNGIITEEKLFTKPSQMPPTLQLQKCKTTSKM